jgi:hypothetical protein
MSTKNTIWFGTDEQGRGIHLYWELAERVPGKTAPIFIEIEANGKQTTIHLPSEIAQEIRDALDPDAGWGVM